MLLDILRKLDERFTKKNIVLNKFFFSSCMYETCLKQQQKRIFCIFFLKLFFFSTLWDGTYREFKLKWGWRTWVLKRHIFELDVQSQFSNEWVHYRHLSVLQVYKSKLLSHRVYGDNFYDELSRSHSYPLREREIKMAISSPFLSRLMTLFNYPLPAKMRNCRHIIWVLLEISRRCLTKKIEPWLSKM